MNTSSVIEVVLLGGGDIIHVFIIRFVYSNLN